MISRRRIVGLSLTGAATGAALVARSRPAGASRRHVVRAAMHQALLELDPVTSASAATRNHAYMIYDTLFAMDADGQIQPQMVERYEVGEDGKVYRFWLRDGLVFHDGQKVTARDVVASIRRWGAADVTGRLLMAAAGEITARDDDCFEITLKQPFGLVLQALGKPSTNVLFIMPERIAQTPADRPITEHVGSGPFTFEGSRWKPGAVTVYRRFEGYVPRSEPPSWGAGRKEVKVDRVEWVYAQDPASAVNALLAGDVDLVEQPPLDQVAILEDDAETRLVDQNSLGFQLFLRFNALWPPFDNPLLRAAALACMNQEDFLKSAVGDPHYYETCPAMFVCETPLASPDGGTALLKSDFERCKRLLREGGYDNTPVVILQPQDVPVLSALAPVARQLLERGGFKVHVVTLSAADYFARRNRRDRPAAGGWSLFLASASAVDVLDPIGTPMLNATGEAGYLGWFNDETLEAMKRDFAAQSDPATRQRQARDIQLYALEKLVTHAFLGQYKIPMAVHGSLSGIVPGAAPYFWNMEKSA